VALLGLSVCCLPIATEADVVVSATEPEAIEASLDQRTWHTVSVVQDESGLPITVTNQWVELATGLMRPDPATGESVPCKAEFEELEGGFVVRQTRYQLILGKSPTDPQAVAVLLPDGQRMRSRVLAIQLWDAAANKGVTIATVRDAPGKLVEPTRVVFADAFEGAIEGLPLEADIEYAIGLDGLHQNVVLRDGLPDLAKIGLDAKPETVRVEVWTEFLEFPAPQLEPVVLWAEPDPAVRAQLAGPDWIDDRLDLGSVQMPMGRARVANAALAEPATLPLVKYWTQIGEPARTFLIEQTPYVEALKLMADAPKENNGRLFALGHEKRHGEPRATRKPRRAAERDVPKLVAGTSARNRAAVASSSPQREAGITAGGGGALRRSALVLDYQLLSSSTEITLRGDTTYYVSASVNLSGANNVLEGGAVLKFAPGAAINVLGTLTCKTAPYRPAVFTAKDDNNYGETISGSNPGNLSATYYGNPALYFQNTGSDIRHVRIFHAQQGIRYNFFGAHTVSHAQFRRCLSPVLPYYATVSARNLLVQDASSVFDSGTHPMVAHCEHLTVNTANYLASAGASGSALHATNCVFASVTNLQLNSNAIFDGRANGFYATQWFGTQQKTAQSDPFLSGGQGLHYLAPGSVFRDAGSAGINPDLLADLKQKTTAAPQVFNATLTADVTLGGWALADSDPWPDLGYHYEILHWLIGDLPVSGVGVLLTNGVAIGVTGTTGFKLQAGSKLTSEGTPQNPNRLVRCSSVQEQPPTSGPGGTTSTWFQENLTTGTLPTVTLRFTECAALSGGGSHFSGGSKLGSLTISDSALYSGSLYFNVAATASRTVTFFNSLFQRVAITLGTGSDTYLTANSRNCLFKNCPAINVNAATGNNWEWKDNAFDSSPVWTYYGYINNSSHNGYIGGGTRMLPNSPTDTVLASFTYATGPLGVFYQVSTDFIKGMSRR
jgi:hypothetical protein